MYPVTCTVVNPRSAHRRRDRWWKICCLAAAPLPKRDIDVCMTSSFPSPCGGRVLPIACYYHQRCLIQGTRYHNDGCFGKVGTTVIPVEADTAGSSFCWPSSPVRQFRVRLKVLYRGAFLSVSPFCTGHQNRRGTGFVPCPRRIPSAHSPKGGVRARLTD